MHRQELLRGLVTEFHHLIIWGHGLAVIEGVLAAVEDNTWARIHRVRETSDRSVGDLVAKAYAHDSSRIKHLKAKTAYLKGFEPRALHVVVAKAPGPFVLEKSPQGWIAVDAEVRGMKWEIRERFNPIEMGRTSSHHHVIHASDSAAQSAMTWKRFFGEESVIADQTATRSHFGLQIPRHLRVDKRIRFEKVKPHTLRASILTRLGVRRVSLFDTPQYQMLRSNDSSPYEAYLKEFRGKGLTDWYSVEKFRALQGSATTVRQNPILVRKESSHGSDYLILDGLHRAAIAAHKEWDFVDVGVISAR